jgi:hypothetical protein
MVSSHALPCCARGPQWYADPAFGRASGAALLPFWMSPFLYQVLSISPVIVVAASGASRIPLR